MSDAFVPFDDMRRRVSEALAGSETPDVDIYLVRNLFGKLRISVSDVVEENENHCAALEHLAGKLTEALGARGYPADDGVLYVSDSLLETLRDTATPIKGFHKVFWEDRLITGNDWWTVGDPPRKGNAKRWTLFSVKGGVGRSTTAAVLAWYLAHKGEKVLVVDLDLESPGLSSAMLDAGAQPEFGVVDWFVEDLVGQSDRVIENMTARPAWADDLNGTAVVAPAHGRMPGEYLAKLGRVYMDSVKKPWTSRLEDLLAGLEARFHPTVVLIESRSGLHDIAAATLTDIGAEGLLFATDSDSSWTDYAILFDHWRDRSMAERIRERLWLVSALTPPNDEIAYLGRFRERAWDLFTNRLYDDGDACGDLEAPFWFDLDDEGSPHDALPIYWNTGFAAGASLRTLEKSPIKLAYESFLKRFDHLNRVRDGE